MLLSILRGIICFMILCKPEIFPERNMLLLSTMNKLVFYIIIPEILNFLARERGQRVCIQVYVGKLVVTTFARFYSLFVCKSV